MISAKQEIKEALEGKILERLQADECDSASLKIALDYLKVYPVDEFEVENTVVLPKKGVLKQFANRM